MVMRSFITLGLTVALVGCGGTGEKKTPDGRAGTDALGDDGGGGAMGGAGGGGAGGTSGAGGAAPGDGPRDGSVTNPDSGTAGTGDASVGGAGGTPDAGGGAGGTAGAGGAGGIAGTGGAGGLDAAPPCRGPGESCLADSACCSGSCDLTTMMCRSSIVRCAPDGAGCVVATDCCSLSCTGGRCATACTADGQACMSSGACCGGNCQGGTCQPLNTACKTAGNPCATGAECCSRLCTGGRCALGASYCIQPGDLCYRSTDCCTGLCSIATGATAGVCKTLEVGGAGGCTQDGVVCGDCGSCCSRLCAPWVTGVKICQPPSGCRVTNNLCRANTDCCGGDPTAISEGAGRTTCEFAAGVTPPLGVCRNPMGCQPHGNICGGPSGQCGVNERAACCDCPGDPKKCCKRDTVGIYRCFGGGSAQCPTGYTGQSPCCITYGERCTFAAECCNAVPCVPDGQGVLRCLRPSDAGVACVPDGGRCTTTGDCCTGLACNIVPGDTTGTCGRPPPPPETPPADAGAPPDGDPGTDAGPSDAAPPPDGTGPADADDAPAPADAEPSDMAPPPDMPPMCALFGQACGDTIACCSPTPCNGPGFSGIPCMPGQAGCSCYFFE